MCQYRKCSVFYLYTDVRQLELLKIITLKSIGKKIVFVAKNAFYMCPKHIVNDHHCANAYCVL